MKQHVMLLTLELVKPVPMLGQSHLQHDLLSSLYVPPAILQAPVSEDGVLQHGYSKNERKRSFVITH